MILVNSKMYRKDNVINFEIFLNDLGIKRGKMMLVKTLKQCVRWTAVNLACLTMVFSPVAMGRETETLNEKVLQSYLQEFGLTGKKVTLGEFWEKSKNYFPAFVHKDLEKFVQENKNMQMPEITVTNAKATDGATVPVLRVTSGGKSTTIQIFGEKNKWAKYNNVVLSEDDLRNVGDVFRRIEASDIRLKKESDAYFKNRSGKTDKQKIEDAKYLEKVVKDFARFKGFPRISPAQWKIMAPQQRAGFIVNMRILWKDARQVLLLEEMNTEATIQNQKKPAAKGKKYSSFEEFSRILLGEPAEAANGSSQAAPASGAKPQLSRKGESVVKPGAASAPAAPQSKKCIVAGYVSEEGKGVNYAGQTATVCSEAMVFQSEKYNRNTPEMQMVREAKFECQDVSQNHVACNPLIYGYKSDGAAICVDRTQKTPNAPAAGNFQKATWWDGPCDSASRLTSAQITQDGMKSSDKSYKDDQKRFDESGNIKAEVAQKQINLVEEDQFKNDSYKQTKSFLDGILQNKKRKNDKIDYSMDDLIQGKKPWSKEIDDMLIDIQTQFEVEIGEAIQSCEKSISRKDNVDKNQKGACDQLHRRWLFTERFISQFRAKSCLGGSTYIWELDATKMSKDQIDNAKLNKEKLKSDSELMCQCKEDPSKKIKFNDAKGCGKPDLPPGVKCPEGMNEDVTGFCTCPGGTEFIPMADALNRVSSEGIEKVCPAKPESTCGKPEGIDGYDYTKCECTKGDLKDENEQGFISKLFNGKQERTPKWVCKETNLWPWVLGALGIAALIAIFHRHKKDPPKPPVIPPPSCAPKVGTYPNCVCASTNTCVPGQQIYDTSTCQCTNVPETPKCPDKTPAPNGNVAACPKCPDNSYRTEPSSARPDGCPKSSEGGTGTPTCPGGSCSGGVPVGQ